MIKGLKLGFAITATLSVDWKRFSRRKKNRWKISKGRFRMSRALLTNRISLEVISRNKNKITI